MGRHTRKKKRVKIHYGRFCLFLGVVAAVIFAGILFWPLPAKAEPEVFETDPLEEETPEPVHLSIRACGDIMCHPAQYQS
ncbi:MAG: hypothetical protein IKN28_08420, partial [Firmicutes bacterium]|nr:hypothetical protein [Bacillota bacterium]